MKQKLLILISFLFIFFFAPQQIAAQGTCTCTYSGTACQTVVDECDDEMGFVAQCGSGINECDESSTSCSCISTSCGVEGNDCCPGNTCSGSLTCIQNQGLGQCVDCDSNWQPGCPSTGACSDPGDDCCAGNVCDGGLKCVENQGGYFCADCVNNPIPSCIDSEGCGANGQECCSPFWTCDPDLECHSTQGVPHCFDCVNNPAPNCNFDFVPPVPNPNLICGHTNINTAIGCINVGEVGEFTGEVLVLGLGIGGGIALLLMGIAGIIIKVSGGNPDRIQAGKELLFAAIAGLLLIIFSVYFLRLTGAEILGIEQLTATPTPTP